MATRSVASAHVAGNGWTGRDPVTQQLQENATLWPGGIRSLAAYLHERGLQLGCYTSPSLKNCCGEPGSLGHERTDMETFAAWGCDHARAWAQAC